MNKYLPVIGSNIIEDEGKILFRKWIYYCENDFTN